MSNDAPSQENSSHLLMYAIAKAPCMSTDLLGIKDQPVRWIQLPSFGIFASDIDLDHIRPQRSFLQGYYRVLSNLMKSDSAILPLSFGSIADDRQALADQLLPMEDAILDRLLYVEGCFEISLKVSTVSSNIFELVAKRDEGIRDAVAFYRSHPGQLSLDTRVEVGRKLEKLLTDYRKWLENSISEALGGSFKDMKVVDGKTKSELLEFCFLVPKVQQVRFEAKVREFTVQIPDSDDLSLIISNPMLPFSFAEVPLA